MTTPKAHDLAARVIHYVRDADRYTHAIVQRDLGTATVGELTDAREDAARLHTALTLAVIYRSKLDQLRQEKK